VYGGDVEVMFFSPLSSTFVFLTAISGQMAERYVNVGPLRSTVCLG